MANRIGQFVFWVAFICSSAGCNAHLAEYRSISFEYSERWFGAIDNTPTLYEVIELKDVKVIIVGDRNQFDWDKAAAYGSPIVAYAKRNNEICLLGKRVGNTIVVNQAILGHELNHLLNFKNPEIADPDRLDNLGL